MRRLSLISFSVCLLAVAGILGLRGCSRFNSENVGIALIGKSTNQANVSFAVLQVTNPGPYRIYSPDACRVQTGATSKWVYVHTSDLWVEPGKTASVSVPVTGWSNQWRVSVGYIVETPWNRMKGRLGASSLEPRLPRQLVSVRSGEAVSGWILP